ncbi:MAG: 23S rRNA pseudouridine(1911/1915/1917) synthase RluD [Chiayiivirga sp.]|jgi:23S rRNA pseudouridine1911/1915/1917 synthase|uniref:Pseudouridine synthase n=1 Tax=Denitratimonas tolerans TaxID=1338420 RepID=A0AAW9R6X1_9GAMM|nr:23S rRNA pseudouridine(1911/1915/1917) synthase RluD [Xanthomonadaceae bacterium]MDX9763927.1 23S rRNA pseudouridine(1911/1915/1917) synthase RluD [Chiayiivirga sp.]HMN35994.1 23S rRNA pseudouridine(1911/1915/1917) synthase RluD [Chiayiivirga sp.]HRO87732.1 23S rRNA pseudouridine(1911/1915/1917) synthase RluD [Chiayiivirga sp.]HRQ35443.1 23S rRNA pseudouridine(1911/1915/1917) synthase RluD [Chiayiivirga sp.]
MPPDSPATQVTQAALIPEAAAGRRVDQALADLFPEFSRSRLTAWLKAGQITLDGTVPRPRDAVRGGEQVMLCAALEPATRSQAEPIALDILYEDAHLLVVNKPAGLVVHPGAGNPDGTLVNALLHHDPDLAVLPRAGIVHRLDKETSGALIVARTLEAHTALVEQLAAREIHRQYEAIVNGTMIAGGTVDAPLERHPVDRLRRAVREDGKPAVTHYRVRERFRAHTRLECTLETGRTHQIRVHMAHIRHPLVGDTLYGGTLRLPKAASDALVLTLRGFRRQALHAERVALAHPIHGNPIEVNAPAPADLLALAAALRADTAAHADDGR